MPLRPLTNHDSYLTNKILISAKYAILEVDTPNSGGKDGGGRIPVLETEQGCIFSTTAIARYLARLRRDVGLFGGIVLDGGMIDSWIEFCVHEFEVGLFQSASVRLDVILWDAQPGPPRRLDSRCQKLAQSTC